MADKATPKLAGIKFDLTKLNTLTRPLELAQQRVIGTTVTMPETTTPLVQNSDAGVAGVGITADKVSNFQGR
jgi:hypothetical protein